MNIIADIIGWVDDHLDAIGVLIILGVGVVILAATAGAIATSTDDVRVYCVTSNGRPEVLYDGVARVSSRDPYVTLTDAATGRQVILVNATCRISQKDPE